VKLNKRERKFIVVGGVVVATALLVYVVLLLLPDFESRTSVEQKRRKLLQYKEMLNSEELYTTRIEQYRKRLQEDSNRLLPGETPNVAGADLTNVLVQFATQNGVTISRREQQSEQKLQNNLIRIPVRMDMTCNMDQLVQFLSAVENYDKLLTVDELSIASFQIQKRWDTRPNVTISGYISSQETKPAEKAPGGSF
jgi:Tfp pilus assembly protein PilO